MTETPAAGWDNFYIMVGSSAAALTGLTFVVIALAADAQRISAGGLRAFITPTIVHFGTVLALAAFLIVPRQNAVSLGLGFRILGVAGLGRLDLARHAADRRLCGYPGDGVSGGACTAATALLFVGIHNAWDVATSISLRRAPDSRSSTLDS